MAGILFGAEFLQPSASANKPHIFGFNTARSAANDTLFEVWNGVTAAGIKAAVDLNGKYYSAALTAGDILYAVAGGVSNVKRLDSLAIGAANAVLRVNAGATAPEWSATLAGLSLTSPTVTGTLTLTGATVTGLTAASIAAGTFPAGAFSIPTLAVTSGLTLTGAAITGAPTWSSAQTMNITGNVTGNVTGSSGSTTGNAATATALATPRTIGGVSFDGTANIKGPQILGGGPLPGTAFASGAANYFSPVRLTTGSTNELDNGFVVPVAGTLKNMYMRSGAASVSTATVTLRKNGGNTALTLTLPSGAYQTSSDTTHSVDVVAGDVITVSATSASGTSVTSFSIEFDVA